MRRLIWLPVAGFLLIAGAAAAAATPAVINTATAALNMPAAAGSLLADVLADLVGDGTITQQQSDTITEAVDTKRQERRAEMDQRREEMRAEMDQRRAERRATQEQIRGFLEDDVITQDELDQLPADHPLRSLETALDDGQITLDELRDLRGGFRGFGPGGKGGDGGWGHHFRGHGDWAPDSGSDDTDTGTGDQTSS